MGVKILGGIGRGLSLFVPKEETTRPTSILLRRRIFDGNQHLDGFTFIDLCAGSGAMGIEAWSRGAAKVIFIEKDKSAFKILRTNINLVKDRFLQECNERSLNACEVSCEVWMKNFKKGYLAGIYGNLEDVIIFFDPPYEQTKLYEEVIETDILCEEWFRGTLWIESDNQKGVPLPYWEKYSPIKTYQQGTSFILVLNSHQ